MTARPRVRSITPALLRRYPLPRLDEDGDKNDRGTVLVVGGSRETPGALRLAGVAALRAGAGRLRLATCASVAPSLGIAVPEARVVPLRESRDGVIHTGAAEALAEHVDRANAILVGPGMFDQDEAADFTRRLLERVSDATVIVDTAALVALASTPDVLHRFGGRAIVTPHAGELAGLMGWEKEKITADPLAAVKTAADQLRCVVVLKGADTVVAAPDGEAFRYAAGRVGLATSGSGDVLAGIIAGLAARGADPLRAALWGVAIHGEAGNVLAEKIAPTGFLAGELADEVPGVMARFSRAWS